MAQRKTGARADTGNKSRTGCLIWLIMLLVTLLLFVFSWDKIASTLKDTGFIDAVGSKPAGATPAEGKPVDAKPAGAPAASVPAADTRSGDGSLEPGATPPVPAAPAPAPAPAAAKPEPAVPAAKPAAATPKPTVGTPKPAVTEPPKASPMEAVKSTRMAVLYFIRVDDDGTISRHDVKRTVAASDSPMSDALDALMSGPNADELARGYISLIPSDARLISAQVRGSTAYLNFNEAFMYNRYGIEGYAGQLKQIVYTATGYPTVKDVQILIDGQKREYLGGDGVYIGKPLSRASF